MALLYDRVFKQRQNRVDKSDATRNLSFDTLCKSLKGILVLFEGEQSYARDTSKFYNLNPKGTGEGVFSNPSPPPPVRFFG